MTVRLESFAHPSEEHFASLLDFYGVRWEYEPTTFVLERHETGGIASAFTPDFYLPDFDLFLEVTTMRQSLVTKKNRKVRQLRQAHPDLQIRVLYQRDLAMLQEKFQMVAA